MTWPQFAVEALHRWYEQGGMSITAADLPLTRHTGPLVMILFAPDATLRSVASQRFYSAFGLHNDRRNIMSRFFNSPWLKRYMGS